MVSIADPNYTNKATTEQKIGDAILGIGYWFWFLVVLGTVYTVIKCTFFGG